MGGFSGVARWRKEIREKSRAVQEICHYTFALFSRDIFRLGKPPQHGIHRPPPWV
jgi:hypothetical protein